MGYSIVKAGHRFGKLVTVREIGRTKAGNKKWLCRCDCGKEVERTAKSLRAKQANPSCGCSRVVISPGSLTTVKDQSGKRRQTRTYKSWTSAIQRCHNPKNCNYPDYGGKGISVCDEWRNSFATFLAHMGERPEGKTLDRWPNRKGNYEPGNCRWATTREQLLNRDFGYQLEFNGEKLGLREVSKRTGIPYDRVRRAFHDGRLDLSSGSEIKVKSFARAFGPTPSALTDEQIAEIRSLRGVVTTKALAERFCLSRPYIGRIQRGLRLADRGTPSEPCPDVTD